MKNVVKVVFLPSLLFFFSTTAIAKNKQSPKMTVKTKAHQCAVYKKNAKKAKKLYSANKSKAKKINVQLKVLAKDAHRMPANVKLAKKVVSHQLHRLEVTKKKSLSLSLKYLEKHIQYVKAAQRTCAQNRAKPRTRFKGQDVNKYLSIAAY